MACAGLGACQGKAVLTKGTSRKALAKASYDVVVGKPGKVRLRATKAGKKLFTGDGKVKLKLTLRGNGQQVRAKVTVRY